MLDDTPPPKAEPVLRAAPTINEVLALAAANGEEGEDGLTDLTDSSSDDANPKDTETSSEGEPDKDKDEDEDDKEETLNVHYLLTQFEEMAKDTDQTAENTQTHEQNSTGVEADPIPEDAGDNTFEDEVKQAVVSSLETWL